MLMSAKKQRIKNRVKRARQRFAAMSDEVLFKKPPPQDDCPICSLRLPSLISGRSYRVCCGKELCVACFRAPVYNHLGEKKIQNALSVELRFVNQTRSTLKIS